MKTIGIFQLQQKKFDTLEFDGEWLASLGKPEKNFACSIYGKSGGGKTDFTIKLAKYLSQFMRVLYLSHEEGISSTIQEAFKRNNMHEVNKRVILGEKSPFDDLVAYLKRKNSPGCLIIDSENYMRLTMEQYKTLRKTFPKKAIIIISWSKGDRPASKPGQDIEYMADIKIHVKNYIAFPRSRYGGNEPFIIWDKKADLTLIED